VETKAIPNAAARQDAGDRITAAETGLLASYRKLPPKYQRRLREQAAEFETLSRSLPPREALRAPPRSSPRTSSDLDPP
jgi:hypothetical protein